MSIQNNNNNNRNPFNNATPASSGGSKYDTGFSFLEGGKTPSTSRKRGRTGTGNISRAGTGSSSGGKPRTTIDGTPVYIISIIDNKAREIGIAAMNLKTSVLCLSQFVENSATTYNNVCNMLQIYSPCVEVVMPKTLAGSNLAQSIQQENPGTLQSFIPRKLFNETKGHIMFKQLGLPECSSIEAEIAKKYLCVSAAAALIDYIEYIQSITFASRSIKLLYKPLTGHLLVDASSIVNLELVQNLKTGKKENTLLSVLDHTKTPMGARLLRSSLLQPLTDIVTINTRLDCVEEVLKKEQEFFSISNVLTGFPDMDHLLSQFCQTLKKATAKSGQTTIMNIITLKKLLEQVLELEAVVREYENPIFNAIAQNIQDEGLMDLSEEIERIIQADVSISKNALNMQTQKCFAVKPGINGLLDVARRQYTEIIEELHNSANKYKEKTGITSLKLQFNIRRGYYLSFDSKTNLSPESKRLFIQMTKQTKRVVCSTEELNSINFKIKDVLEEIYLLTDTVIDDLVANIRQKLSLLFKVSESIALLDMLFSFAHLVTLSNEYIRPEFTKDGPIAIKAGKHPVLEKSSLGHVLVPNDTYLSESSNFQILTGANMSGKSTYIRQIALLTIMAHIGSFIPAKFASFRIVDKLFTRIGTDDNIENNSSTFMVEMTEVSYIIQNATSKSLILIDELGRGTSNIEGNSIAWSVCEYLLSTLAYSVFVTHYMQLVELELLYPNVKNYHCMVSTTEGGLDYMYSVGEGSCNEDNYGIKLAKMLNLPRELIAQAEDICREVTFERKRKSDMSNNSNQHVQHLRTCYQLAHRLICLRHSSLDQQAMKTYLKSMKEKSNDILAIMNRMRATKNAVPQNENKVELPNSECIEEGSISTIEPTPQNDILESNEFCNPLPIPGTPSLAENTTLNDLEK